jgi:hypothetical protein
MKKKAPKARRATRVSRSGKRTVRDLEVKGVRGGSIKGGLSCATGKHLGEVIITTK